MHTHLLLRATAVASLLAVVLAPAAFANDFVGQHRLQGNDSSGRHTEATLTVEQTPSGLRVTREAQWTQAQVAFRWTSETASVAGSTLFVRYEVPATLVGASGVVAGQAGTANVFMAMITRPDTGPLRETIYNTTRLAPDDDWAWIRARAVPDPAAGLPADLRPLVRRWADMVEEDPYGEITFTQEVVRIDAETWAAPMKILKREADDVDGMDIVLEEFTVKDLTLYQYQDEVMDQILAEAGTGYFADAFKAYGPGTMTADNSRQLVRQLLAEVAGPDHLNAYMVVVQGNSWGDYRDVRLYVQSRDDPKVFLRYFFDIVHEI
jgi:hypothetical protein